MQDYLISDLRKQREQLDQLIRHLKEKERFDKSDLVEYDQITKKIEKRLRTLRNVIEKETVSIQKNRT